MAARPDSAVEKAFNYFRREVLARTGSPTELSSEPGADLMSIAVHRGAGLRLVWRERGHVLRLEISQGPATGGIAGWLTLYRANVIGDELASDHDVSFEEAVAYGLELLDPTA